jgi:hypothetical protein
MVIKERVLLILDKGGMCKIYMMKRRAIDSLYREFPLDLSNHPYFEGSQLPAKIASMNRKRTNSG